MQCCDTGRLINAIEGIFPAIRSTEPTMGKVVFRIDGVICNIFITTGTVNFQGKNTPEAQVIIKTISNIVETINMG